MKRPNNHNFENEDIEREAANWVLRHDRGLTADEQDEYSQWLARDPRHKEAMAPLKWGWDEFDRLAGLQNSHHAEIDPDLLAPGNRYARKSYLSKGLIALLPLAVCIAMMVFFFGRDRSQDKTSFETKSAIELIARIENRLLEDGSRISLNRGAVVEVEYTEAIRRVRLLRGEANFEVAKDASRPFVVNVAGVDVRAVGTQFNVRLTNEAVNVIVSEGIVSVKPTDELLDSYAEIEKPLLEVGYRAVLALEGNPQMDVTQLSEFEMDSELRWQPRLMDFDDVPMPEIVAAFNLRNEVQLVLNDTSLEELRLSYSFWSDNLEGFVRLMESSFGMRAEWRNSTEIVLNDARGLSSHH